MKNLLLLVAVASFASCKKENYANQLPEPSSSGKNFLSYKINGVLHNYSGTISWTSPTGVGNRRFLDKLIISGRESIYNDELSIIISQPPNSIEKDITYQLGDETSKSLGKYVVFESQGSPQSVYMSNVNSGWVRFSRVDTSVSAGTFAFTAYVETLRGTDSVIITEGVFDIAAE